MSSVPPIVRISYYITRYGAFSEGIDISGLLPAVEPGVVEWSGPFETRKVVMVWARSPAGSPGENVAECTLQLLKLSGGAPTNEWSDADYANAVADLQTFVYYRTADMLPIYSLREYRFYADGPAYHPAPVGGNPARKVVPESSTGGGASVSHGLAPQSAMSITFKTDSRRHWGRIYWPVSDPTLLDGNQRFDNSRCDTYATGMHDALVLLQGHNLIPVVYSISGAMARSIDSVQVDNIVDIIRRRRWSASTYRKVLTTP